MAGERYFKRAVRAVMIVSGAGVEVSGATSAQIGEVQASPTANTVLDRLKTIAANVASLLTGISLAASTALIGVVKTRIFAVAAAVALTRPANTTAYSINDAVSDNATAGSVTALSFTVSDTNDDTVMLRRMRINTTDTGPGTALATFQAYLYQTNPTASSGVVGGDNAAFSTKMGTFIGTMSGSFRSFSDGSAAVLTPDDGSEIICGPTTGAKTVFALIKTLTAFTPSANSTVYNPVLEGVQGKV